MLFFGRTKGGLAWFAFFFFLLTAVGLPLPLQGAETKTIKEALDRTVAFCRNNEATMNQFFSPWLYALGLRSAGQAVPETLDVKLNSTDLEKPTALGAAIIGLTAQGKDPRQAQINGATVDLVTTLVYLQKDDGSFVTGDYITLNHTLWSVIALDFYQRNLDQGSELYDGQKAVEYIKSQQKDNGSFDESGWGADADSTAHALIALSNHVSTDDQVVVKALDYLKSKQNDTGFIDCYGDNPSSTAAVIEALWALGLDPQSEDWTKNGKSLVDALLASQKENGSFIEESSWGPIDHTPYALLALADLVNGFSKYRAPLPLPSPNQPPDSDNNTSPVQEPDTGSSPSGQTQTASISIKADVGYILSPTIYTWKGTLTALQLLQNTAQSLGIDLVIRNGYVAGIGGLKEFDRGPKSGWIYKVNGSIPPVGAGSCLVRDGDVVEWFYVTDYEKEAPAGTVSTPSQKDSKAWSSEYQDLFNIFPSSEGKPVLFSTSVKDMIKVINASETMKEEEARRLQAELEQTEVRIRAEVDGQKDQEVKATNGEVALLVPQGAISEKLNLEIREETGTLQGVDCSGCVSSLYRFGPRGVVFKQPVYIEIKTPIIDLDPQNLALAYYDEEQGLWVALPTVVDVKNGLVTGRVEHFTLFAVIDIRKAEKTFQDLETRAQRLKEHLQKQPFSDQWQVLSLLLNEAKDWESYAPRLAEEIKNAEKQNVRVTDVERWCLLAAALGLNPKSVEGVDLLGMIYDSDRLTAQGPNGVAFGLIALDGIKAEIPPSARWTREKMIEWLLASQKDSGAWSLTPDSPEDVDLTAMCITALAPYQKQAEVGEAVRKALAWLAAKQLETGGFAVYGEENSESSSQVIIALTSYGLSPYHRAFAKAHGNLLSRWLSFQNQDGGFSHLPDQPSDSMASTQALLAFKAIQLWREGKPGLYNFQTQDAFDDAAHISPWAKEAVQKARRLGLVKGISTNPNRFAPKRIITRAELAAMLVRFFPQSSSPASTAFKDVPAQAWYNESTARVAALGWMKGKKPDIFAPYDPVTREEMALVVARMLPEENTNTVPTFDDLTPTVEASAVKAAKRGIMVGDGRRFHPRDKVTREMATVILMRLKERLTEPNAG